MNFFKNLPGQVKIIFSLLLSCLVTGQNLTIRATLAPSLKLFLSKTKGLKCPLVPTKGWRTANTLQELEQSALFGTYFLVILKVSNNPQYGSIWYLTIPIRLELFRMVPKIVAMDSYSVNQSRVIPIVGMFLPGHKVYKFSFCSTNNL